MVGNQTYKLCASSPSGLVRKASIGIIGNGVVIDPEALLDEIERVEGARPCQAVTPDPLRIAENATLILPMHSALDRAREAAQWGPQDRHHWPGLGPAYEDKVARRAIRVADLAEPETLADKLDELAVTPQHSAARPGCTSTFSKDEVLARLLSLAPKVLPFGGTFGGMGASCRRKGEARRAGATHPVRGRGRR